MDGTIIGLRWLRAFLGFSTNIFYFCIRIFLKIQIELLCHSFFQNLENSPLLRDNFNKCVLGNWMNCNIIFTKKVLRHQHHKNTIFSVFLVTKDKVPIECVISSFSMRYCCLLKFIWKIPYWNISNRYLRCKFKKCIQIIRHFN